MTKTTSIKDLVACQFSGGEFVRFDIFVRYLAIEEYYGKNDYGFRLYEKMQDKRVGKRVEYTKYIEKFRALIKSYEINGYKKDSAVKVGSNLALRDGSHRIAMGLYHNLPTISIDIEAVPKFKYFDFRLDWFLKNGFSYDEIKIILNKANEVLSAKPNKLTGFLWGGAVPFAEEIFKELQFFGNVSDAKKFSFKSREYYNHMLRRIYAIDDIDISKVNMKADYLAPYNSEFIFFHFTPLGVYNRWRMKKLTNLPMSVAVERAKSIIRERYKGKFDPYFHDIILHICDNSFQSDYCDAVCFPHIDLRKFFADIAHLKYVLTGMRGGGILPRICRKTSRTIFRSAKI